MDERKAIQCVQDGNGEPWRLQCDEASKRCLYAVDGEVDDQGKRTKRLERAPSCAAAGGFDTDRLAREGYTLVPAIPAAPYGWQRDDHGRVFQTNFDLHQRLYLGGGALVSQEGDTRTPLRSYVDFALLELEDTSGSDAPVRHRLRLLEGDVKLAPFAAEGVVVRWDFAEKRRDPLLRVTTFLGEPRRGDVRLDAGFFLEGGRFETFRRPTGAASVWRFGTLDGTLDLAKSRDLVSYLRVRAGASIERAYFDDLPNRTAITPNAALDLDVTVDRDGFHHVTGTAGVEAPRYFDSQGELTTRSAYRERAELAYEVILLALNDQPLTFRVGGVASHRTDVPGLPPGTAYTATAGFRFNLWAPARSP